MRFVKSPRIFAVAISVLVSAGLLTVPVNAATLTPVYLSFETNDALGALAGSPTTNSKKQGSWYGGAQSSISSTLPDGRSGSALQFVKGAGEAVWSGLTLIDAISLTSATYKTITFDYYSPDNTPVMLKMETSKGLSGPSVAKAVNANVGWNKLTFDMSSGKGWSTTTAWSRLSVIPDFKADDTVTTGLVTTVKPADQKYFIDNVSINGGTIADVKDTVPAPEAKPTPSASPVYMNFEAEDGYGAQIGNYAKGHGAFEGGSLVIADSVGGNTDKALKFTKVKSGKQWSGFAALLSSDNLRVTNGSLPTISFNYYTSDTTPVLVELKTDDGGQIQLAKTPTVGWNSLTFDMSQAKSWDANAVWIQLAIFPNFAGTTGVTGQTSPNDQVYYFDNISINGGTSSNVGSPPPPPCIGVPSIRLVSPNVAGDNTDPTYWGGVMEFNDPATMVYVHYYPVGSTVSVKYQTYDAECKPLGAGVKVYLAVNAAYSKSQTTFISFYRGIAAIPAIPKDCAANQFCGEGQTVLNRTTDESGQVTFELINTNQTSPENKPARPNALPPANAALALGSAFAPSFSAYDAATNSGAGGNNAVANEAVDKLWPHFVNGMGAVQPPADSSATKGTNKSLTFTVLDTSGAVAKNTPVTITTNDGGTLVTPDSSTATPDSYGYSSVQGTTDDNGTITVTATSAVTGTQTVRVSYSVNPDDKSVTALNGFTTITWTNPIVPVAQVIGAVATSVKVGKTITLPAKTSKSLVVTWTTSTPKICSISAGKVKGLKVGTCKISGTNAGNTATKPVTKAVTISVKK